MFTESSGCGLSSNQHTWITPNSIVASLREIGEDFNISDKNMTADKFTRHPIYWYWMDILISGKFKLRRTDELW